MEEAKEEQKRDTVDAANGLLSAQEVPVVVHENSATGSHESNTENIKADEKSNTTEDVPPPPLPSTSENAMPFAPPKEQEQSQVQAQIHTKKAYNNGVCICSSK